MQKSEHYKNGDRKGIIDARVHPSADGDGYVAEFSISQDIGAETYETPFRIPNKFGDEDTAMRAALQAGRRKIDEGFELSNPR